jgi:hypothetical protein
MSFTRSYGQDKESPTTNKPKVKKGASNSKQNTFSKKTQLATPKPKQWNKAKIHKGTAKP